MDGRKALATAGRWAKAFGVWVLDLLYPLKCPFCERLLDRDDEGMCPRCGEKLPWVGPGEKEKKVEFCDRCLSALWYRDGVVTGIHRYKFGGAQQHATLFARFMLEVARRELTEPADMVTWVPLSKKRLNRRGYDQARLLAEGLAKGLGIPAVAALEKTRDTNTQSRIKEDDRRRANVRGVYRHLPDRIPAGARVILVDDVTTTGATLSECAACLRLAGAGEVIALTLVRARK